MTLKEQLDLLYAGTTTIVSGVIAQLTREAYSTPYTDIINFQQYVPIIYFNIIQNAVTTNPNPTVISFTIDDLFVADDWIILNETPV